MLMKLPLANMSEGSRLRLLSAEEKVKISPTFYEQLFCTGKPRYPRSLYLRIRSFANVKLVLKTKFQVKVCLFYMRIQ